MMRESFDPVEVLAAGDRRCGHCDALFTSKNLPNGKCRITHAIPQIGVGSMIWLVCEKCAGEMHRVGSLPDKRISEARRATTDHMLALAPSKGSA